MQQDPRWLSGKAPDDWTPESEIEDGNTEPEENESKFQEATEDAPKQVDTALAVRFGDLANEKQTLETRRAEIIDEMRKIDAILQQQFIDSDVQSIRLSNGRTVYIEKKIFAKINDKVAAAEALRATGYGDFVSDTFNTNSISSLLREFDTEGKALPKEFDGLIEASTVYKIKSRAK